MINMQKTEKIIKLYVEKLILPSEPLYPRWNRENFIFSKPGKWNYVDGCMIKAVLMLYDISKDKRLLDYAVSFTDFYVAQDGSIPSMKAQDYNLDNINGGKNLIALYEITGNEKYRLAYEKLFSSQLMSQPRLSCKNFYHKAIYPHQIWLDGLYMALPFMAQYAVISGDCAIADDIFTQIQNVSSLMRDKSTGLYYHGFDESRSTCWADPKTGLSQRFWLRSTGWFCAALADLCEISEGFPKLFRLCADTLKELLCSLSAFITCEDMLYQLPDMPELEGNYPETSGTLLFSYAAMKAYRLGVCDEKIKADGIRTLSAVVDKFIDFGPEDLPVLKNVCLVAGLGGQQNRDGSAQYYLSEPVTENEGKAIAPLIMAYTELMRLSAQ